MSDVRSIFPLKKTPYNNLEHHPLQASSARHPRLKALIKFLGPLKFKLPVWDSIDNAVLYAVIGQMLSGKAASSIIKRLLQKFGTSARIIEWADKNYIIKGAIDGVSQRKRRALHEWAIYAGNNGNHFGNWKLLPLSDYRREICSIWGFGRWSADMIAIFHLGRLDIWPENDTGIKKSCKAVFGCADYKKILRYINGSETITALYLWELLNRNLVKEFTKRHNG